MQTLTSINRPPINSRRSSGQSDRFEALYNKYAKKVYQYCLALTKDAEQAQDFTHDVFIKVFDKLDTFQHQARFSTWLYAVCHHYCLDQLKKSKRLASQPLSEDQVSYSPSADETEHQESRLLEMEALLHTLPAEDVIILRLKYEQGLTSQAIGELYNLKDSAVKMRLKRSRDKLYARYRAYKQEG